MVIEELTAIVGIKAQKGKREHFFDIFDLFQNTSFSFAPDRSLFCPARGNVDKVNGVGKHPHERITAMGDGVRFDAVALHF